MLPWKDVAFVQFNLNVFALCLNGSYMKKIRRHYNESVRMIKTEFNL